VGEQVALLRFAALFFGVKFVVFELPSLLLSVSHLFVLLHVVFLWLLARIMPAYPATALDVHNPLKNGWKISRCHWWFTAFAMLLGLAPFFLMGTPIGLALIHPNTSEMGYFVSKVVAPAIGGLAPVEAAVGAGILSVMYRKFGGLKKREYSF
jgi:hypothetical protein